MGRPRAALRHPARDRGAARRGTDVIANLSRGRAARCAPDLPGHAGARADRRGPRCLRRGLPARGRETAEDIAERLARAGEFTVTGPDVVMLDNSGTPAETVAAARAALYPDRV